MFWLGELVWCLCFGIGLVDVAGFWDLVWLTLPDFRVGKFGSWWFSDFVGFLGLGWCLLWLFVLGLIICYLD